MRTSRQIIVIAFILTAAHAWAAPPRIGYLYPAGGQQGKVFEVLAGGQFLNGVSNVYVSGEGVSATITKYGRPLNNKQVNEVRRLLNILMKARRAGEEGKTFQSLLAQGVAMLDSKVSPPPDHPLLRNVDRMSLKELEHWTGVYFNVAKRQQNMQISEMVLMEFAVAPDAAPGWREVRLATPTGLTNPMCFYVGALPEICEKEPNDLDGSMLPVTEVPVVLNGQIMPGDTDRFPLRLLKGQKLVVQAQARRLVPYLADAVPGWFQATLALYDGFGKELAFADDYGCDPDPVMLYDVPEDGEYTLEVRDAIYRGREDFVYRVTVGPQPFITQCYPLGAQMGDKVQASINGWNLSERRVELDTQQGAAGIRHISLTDNGGQSNEFPYLVDVIREDKEKETNDAIADAQRVDLPTIVNGRIDRADDVDVFQFKGRAGEKVVAEVYARRLNSPMDSLLRLMDASGHVLAWNDDHEDKENGLLAHQADSYLCAELKEDGAYYFQLSDTQHHGGEAYAYRLRIGPPRPDFSLRVTPSSISVPAGRDAVFSAHVLRKEGFDGPVELVLKDAPAGFTLSGALVPKGRDSVRLTLRAAKQAPDTPFALHMKGNATIDGSAVSHEAVPSEDMMQAFIYRHLVPSQTLQVLATNTKRPAPPIGLANEGSVRIPLGGMAQVVINTPKRPMLENIRLTLSDPPKGLTLSDVTVVPEGLRLTLKAEEMQAGYADNVIVEAFMETDMPQKDGKPAKQKQRNAMGVLPAIPIEIVQP